MKNPTAVLPDALHAMRALGKSAHGGGLPPVTIMLVHFRASQINGCTFCVDMHSRELSEAGETNQRIFTVAAWREAPWFTDAERAALALTEAATRLADKSEPVPGAVWDEAARHYDEKALAALVIQIGMINLWNRLNATTQQMAGVAWN
jgi:AhpD family alkylhydroperoxidase